MNIKPSKTWIAAVLLTVALAAVTSCGSNGGDTVTGPGPSPGPGPGPGRELNSPDLDFGDTFEHRFAAGGTFPYHCVHHAMNGTVQVSAAAADTLVNVVINSSVAPFPGASVKPGGRVVWVNNTRDLHTVTSD